MPEEVERAPADRHATWVALRTLRQRPTVVGRTESGETVYGIGSARALLATGASHFSRLVQCAKCRREVGGPPLMSPADLDRPPNPVFCETCVRSAGPTSMPPKGEPPTRPAPTPPAAAKGPDPGSPVAAIEARLADVTRRLNSPPAVDPQVAALSAAVAELREAAATSSERIAAQRGEMEQALAEVVQRTLAAVAVPLEEIKARQQVLEAELSEAHAAREQIASGLDELRTEVASLAQATERRLAELTASVDAGASREHVLEQRLNECMELINRLLEVGSAGVPDGTSYRSVGILQGLEQQLREAEERMAQR